MDSTIERQTMHKVYSRILPFAIVTYFFCYLDRINVGFAALTMNSEIGLTATTFGNAAGLFFWGYFMFELPSNIIMDRVGARIWIARIMVSWGLMSFATAFVTGPISFGVMRFLLGVAEAGFFPGMILFFTYWFPDHHRARIVAGFAIALPLAIGLGGPISTAVMEMNGLLGMSGWRWLFMVEAIPTILLGIAVLVLITDKPEQAGWLSPAERDWLGRTLDRERAQKDAVRIYSMLGAMFDPKVLLLALNYFGIVTASLGMAYFIPQIIKQLGLSNLQVGFTTMIPYLCGAAAMIVYGRMSDRAGERRWHLFFACVTACLGLVLAAATTGTWWSIVGMSIAAMGFYGSKGPFFAMPSMFMSGTAIAVSLAWINSLGNLGGYFGPSIVGYARDHSHNFASGMYVLAGFAAMSAVVAAFALRQPRAAEIPMGAPAE